VVPPEILTDPAEVRVPDPEYEPDAEMEILPEFVVT
jgi:hypothetical protein